MKKVFIFILLFLIGTCAYADSSIPSVLNPTQLSHQTDASIYYITQIFGTVGNTLTGGNSQILGVIFDEFNKGILAIAALVVGWTLLHCGIPNTIG